MLKHLLFNKGHSTQAWQVSNSKVAKELKYKTNYGDTENPS